MDDEEVKPGASGVFQVIRAGARKFKRAVTGGGTPLSPEAEELGHVVARAFVAGKFGEIYELLTTEAARQPREQFESAWQALVRDRGPLTGYKVVDAGDIDLDFIPGLEETPQEHFQAFLEIDFSSPEVSLEAGAALAVGIVVLDRDNRIGIGAIHAR